MKFKNIPENGVDMGNELPQIIILKRIKSLKKGGEFIG